MQFPKHLTLRAAACLLPVLLPACSSPDARAQDALGSYQAAAAANDLVGARKALLELVRAKDDVPDYWVELGKFDASTGDYNSAYYAFTRAYELDRNNVDVLRAVTQLALRAGDLGSAESHAEELASVAPDDPWPKLTKGWAAISESHFDQAIGAADSILANAPYDPSATVLKARALIGLNQQGEATDLLIRQTQAQPSDSGSLQMLARVYQRQGDWPKLVGVAQRVTQLLPTDQSNALLLIEAAFRSGNVTVGRGESLRVLRSNVSPGLVSSVLDLWADYWPSPQRLEDAKSLGAQAQGLQQKLAYAAFLSREGSPADAVRLTSAAATLPVDAKSAEANAVLADAWWRLGNYAPAKNRLDAVLAFDPGNASALRARAELELRTGQAPAAVIDAQKLVTVLPNSAPDRLLLARSFAAAGKENWANRTLWTAFQDIPGDESIYAALAMTKKGDPDGARDLREEFDRQRDAKLGRGYV
jgi:predicted Zn-dependent protease